MLKYNKNYEIIFDDLSTVRYNKNEEVFYLPEVDEEYEDLFLGWFVKNTNNKIQVGDKITKNTELEPRFSKNISGAYFDEKLIDTWDDLKLKYPDSFDGDKFCGIRNITYTKIVIDDSVKVIRDGFVNCKSLKEIIIPETVTELCESAFYGCINLIKVNIPNGMDCLKNTLFYGCYKLENVIIPENITQIGASVFANCTNLKEINIPDSVINIGASCFIDCVNLEKITLSKSITSLEKYVFNGCCELNSIKLPPNLTNIKDYAFLGCKKLRSIVFPNKMESIGFKAFSGCDNLSDITISSVISIDRNAFYAISINTASFDVGNVNDEIKIITNIIYVRSNFSEQVTEIQYFTKQQLSDKPGYDMWVRS